MTQFLTLEIDPLDADYRLVKREEILRLCERMDAYRADIIDMAARMTSDYLNVLPKAKRPNVGAPLPEPAKLYRDFVRIHFNQAERRALDLLPAKSSATLSEMIGWLKHGVNHRDTDRKSRLVMNDRKEAVFWFDRRQERVVELLCTNNDRHDRRAWLLVAKLYSNVAEARGLAAALAPGGGVKSFYAAVDELYETVVQAPTAELRLSKELAEKLRVKAAQWDARQPHPLSHSDIGAVSVFACMLGEREQQKLWDNALSPTRNDFVGLSERLGAVFTPAYALGA